MRVAIFCFSILSVSLTSCGGFVSTKTVKIESKKEVLSLSLRTLRIKNHTDGDDGLLDYVVSNVAKDDFVNVYDNFNDFPTLLSADYSNYDYAHIQGPGPLFLSFPANQEYDELLALEFSEYSIYLVNNGTYSAVSDSIVKNIEDSGFLKYCFVYFKNDSKRYYNLACVYNENGSKLLKDISNCVAYDKTTTVSTFTSKKASDDVIDSILVFDNGLD